MLGSSRQLWRYPSRLLAAVALLALLSISPARGAVQAGVEREVWFDDLKAETGFDFGLNYYYQVPENPRGVAAFFHACVHSGYNYWPFSPDCPDCRGLPEEMSHTVQALRRGYAVIAISSIDRQVGCWSWNNDGWAATEVLKKWIKEWGLGDLPLYGAGISSGASFVLKMPRNIKFNGVISEALGIDPVAWGVDEVGAAYPPTIFVSMERDTDTAERIGTNVGMLKERGIPVELIKVQPRQIYPTYFSDRNPLYVNESFSKEIAQGLFEIQMIDKNGNIMEDPRYTERPWMAELQDKVPGLRGSGPAGAIPKFPDQQPQDVLINGVWSLMNLAYAQHEIISDYTTAAFMWFESGGKASMPQLLEANTWGWPSAEPFSYSLTNPGGEVVKPPSVITNSSIAPSTLPGCAKQLTVRPGDFCFFIASSMGMELEAFEAMNPTLNCTTLQPGNVVCVSKAVPKPPPPSPSPPLPSMPPPAATGTGTAPTSSTPGSTASTPSPSPAPPPAAQPSPPHKAHKTSSSNTGISILIGVGVGAGLGVILLAVLAWCCFRRRKRAAAAGAGSGPRPGAEEGIGASAKLSISPGVGAKEAYDLTEVVEASGSPYKPQGRAMTSFLASPELSPTKRRAGTAAAAEGAF